MGMSAEGAGGMSSVCPFQQVESTDGRLERLSKKSHETGGGVRRSERSVWSAGGRGGTGRWLGGRGRLARFQGDLTEQLFTLYPRLNPYLPRAYP